MKPNLPGAIITGWGTALPDKIVTNADLALTLDTSDEWIQERTGIRERRVGGSTAGLAAEAGRKALAAAGVDPADVDLIVLATTTPDETMPATAATVQHELGTACGAFDLNAACAGFVYALAAAHGLVGAGVQRALVIGSETYSRILDWDDRNTAVLFGDGAAAVVLEAHDGPGQLLGWDAGTDAAARIHLHCDLGGTLKMAGKEVFRRAVRVVVDSSQKALASAGLTADDVTLLVPHQANKRIIDAACSRLGIPAERAAMVLDRTANTSAASIPLALADALDHGRLVPGDIVLMVGFGAGMSWASAVLRWGG